MGSRSKDPFNFDDIYRQAGVEDLFVKKSLSEMKKTVPHTVTPTRPEPPKPATNGSIPAVISQHTSPRIVSTADVRPMVSKPSPAVSADPFAGLGFPTINTNTTPAASQLKTAAPLSATNSPRQAPASVDFGFLAPSQPPVMKTITQPQQAATIEFDDIFGTSTSAPAPSTKAAAPLDDDPFALFEAIPGASAPVTTPPVETKSAPMSAPPAAPAPLPQPAVRPVNIDTSIRSHGSQSSLHASHSNKSLHSTSSASNSPRVQQPQFIRSTSPTLPAAKPAAPPPSYEQSFTAPHASYTDQQPLTPRSLARSNSSEDLPQAPSSQSGKSSKRFGGVLGKIGNTVMKAAKDGLATLNDALERFDHVEKYGAPRGYRYSSKDEELPEIPAEEALAHAIQISELAPRQQEEVMGRLPRHIRTKVAEILREQAMAEAEGPTQEESGLTAPYRVSATPSEPEAPAEPEVVQTHEFKLDDETPQAALSPLRAQPAPAPVPAPTAHQPEPQHEDLLGISASTRAAPPAVQDDLLGFDGPPAPAAPAARPAAPAQAAVDVDSVTDFFSGGSAPAAVAAASRHTATPSSDSLDAFFSGGAKPAAPAARPTPSSRPAAAAARPAAPLQQQRSQQAPQPVYADRVGGVVEDHGPMQPTHNGPLFQDHDHEDEPEYRKQLRAQRLAEKERKMQAALEEKLVKEQQEAANRELQVQLKEKYKEDIIAWKNKNKDNVRGLLGSLQTVLWDNSGWKPLGMGDLLEPTQVRKAWMKANLIVHPDKVRQKNGTPDQIAIADMVFDVLKEAWGKFQN